MNEGIKSEVEWTRTMIIKLYISTSGEKSYLDFYLVLNFDDFLYVLDEIEHMCLKKLDKFVNSQSLSFKILSNVIVDFSCFHSIIALVASYTIIIYQMMV